MAKWILKFGIVLTATKVGLSEECVDYWNLTDSGPNLQICYNTTRDHCRFLRVNTTDRLDTRKTEKCSPVHVNLSDNVLPEKHFYGDFHLWSPVVGIFGIMAVLGNVASIGIRGTRMYLEFKTLSKVQKLHNILLMNLSLADFLMGVYLLAIFAFGISFNIPCETPQCFEWQTGDICVIMGVITYVSSEVSVTTLIIITTCRLYSVVRPFKTIKIRPVTIVTVLSWPFWMIVACLPLLKVSPIFDTFHFGMTADNGCSKIPFRADYSQWHKILDVVLAAVNCSHRLPRHRSWEAVRTLLADIKMTNQPNLHFLGYYQEMPTCGVNFIASNDDPALGFLLPMVTINLLAFVYMAIAYTIITTKTGDLDWRRACHPNKCYLFGCSTSTENRRGRENLAMHRRMFFIVLTDFLCWVPMSLIVIARSIDRRSIKLDDNAVLYMTVILFPLNSALNPILYPAQLPNICDKAICVKDGQT